MRVNTDIRFHKAQLEVYKGLNNATFTTICASRGFGKSIFARYIVALKAVSYQGYYNPDAPPVCILTAKTRVAAKQLHWAPLVRFLNQNFSDIIEKIDNSDLAIHFKPEAKKPSIYLRGYDDGGDGIRGFRIYFAAADEVQQLDLTMLQEVVFSAMSSYEGASFLGIGTPKGKNNILYQLKQLSIEEPETYAFYHFTVYDNPTIKLETIERYRRVFPERVFRQEFLATFEDFPGIVFSEFSDENIAIIDRFSDESSKYYLALDPGITNPAMVLLKLTSELDFEVCQTYYQNKGLVHTADDLALIASEIIGSDLRVERIFIPDDRADLVKHFRRQGFNQAVLVRRSNPSPKERIEIINSLFKQNRLKVHKEDLDFIDEIRSYHRESDLSGVVLDKIADGQQDHRIDALSYAVGALCFKNSKLLFKD